MSDDKWPVMPAFLRRPMTEESIRRAKAIVRETVYGDRQWKMPNLKGELSMAKEQSVIATQDPKLPVMMQLTKEGGSTEGRNFDDLQKFRDWFDPKKHKLTGSTATDTNTLVTVEEKTAPKSKAKKAAAPPAEAEEEAGEEAAPEKTGTRVTVSNAGGRKVERGVVIKKKGDKAAAAAEKKAKAPKKEGAGRGGSRAGIARHGCKVAGKEYTSIWKAFQDLKIGDVGACVKFRAVLKASKTGKETYEYEGKKYVFERTEKG